MKAIEGESTFDVNIVGQSSKQSYIGSFKVKCLISPIEEIEADKRYRELLGVNPHLATEHVRRQAFALSQLEQRVIDCPPFWENETLPGGHVKDSNVILEVLDKAIEAQENYINAKDKELKEKQEKLKALIEKKKIKREETPEEE